MPGSSSQHGGLRKVEFLAGDWELQKVMVLFNKEEIGRLIT